MKKAEFIRKETAERLVTVLFQPGAYTPGEQEYRCLACGMTVFDNEEVGRYLDAAGELKIMLPFDMRFCPLCGSRFDHEANVKGLYGPEDDAAEYFGLKQDELQTEEMNWDHL